MQVNDHIVDISDDEPQIVQLPPSVDISNHTDFEFPDLYSLFQQYDAQFFHSALSSVEVKWSKRMTLCAGLCVFKKKERFCSIRLSEPLLQYRTVNEFRETLLHEMIHAYLFITNQDDRRNDHGPLFHIHMHKINSATGLRISVYHKFRDEVDYFRKHIWQCDGPCQKMKPFFGLVKRAMNRAPGPYDWWWKNHKMICNGSFRKISGPTESENTKKALSIKNKKKQIKKEMKKKTEKVENIKIECIEV